MGAQFQRAAIDKPFDPEEHRHVPTTELVGKRVKYVYSQTETYEHIYLNDKLFTWQCLAGSEKGLADTDRCHYVKIDDELYLFVWREKIVPTLGVVLLDWRQKKTTGKLFDYESDDFGELSNTPIGAYATLLNETSMHSSGAILSVGDAGGDRHWQSLVRCKQSRPQSGLPGLRRWGSLQGIVDDRLDLATSALQPTRCGCGTGTRERERVQVLARGRRPDAPRGLAPRL